MTPKFVSEKWAKKWYDLGTQYQDHSSRRSAIRAAIDDGHDIGCWEAAAAFGAGYLGYEWQVQTWQRYGDIPIGYDGYAAPSMNHADNSPELGVSVAAGGWENSILREYVIDRPIVTFRGIQVGHGGDGEPVVLPVQE